MELLTESIQILSPLEMQRLKKESGLTLAALSKRTKISVSQLSEYCSGVNGLKPSQVAECERVLLAACRERSMALAKLLAEDAA